jgi:hypothetical protein
MDRLCASVRRNSRALHLIYVNPVMHSALVQRGFQVKRQGRTFRIYTYAPQGDNGKPLLQSDSPAAVECCGSTLPQRETKGQPVSV